MSESNPTSDVMSNYYQARQHKAAGLFTSIGKQTQNSVATPDTHTGNDIRKLESLMHKEQKVWWNHTTLNSYVESQIIPRGLRLRKNTTSMYTPDFQTQWNDILSTCSFQLISLIIKQEDIRLQEFKSQISVLQQDLKQHMSVDEWSSQFKKIEEGLRKAENIIVQTKKSKFERDQNDYKNNQVYTWHQERRSTPHNKSILKNQRQRNNSMHRRNVSFSDYGNVSDITNVSAANDTLDTSGDICEEQPNRNPNSKGYGGGGVSTRSSKNDQDELDANTRDARQQRQTRKKP